MSWESRFRPHGYELPSPLTPPRAAHLPTGPGMEGAPIPISEGTCGATESPVMLTFPRAQGLTLGAERTLGGQVDGQRPQPAQSATASLPLRLMGMAPKPSSGAFWES